MCLMLLQWNGRPCVLVSGSAEVGADQLLNVTCAIWIKSENYNFYLFQGSFAADCSRYILIGDCEGNQLCNLY